MVAARAGTADPVLASHHSRCPCRVTQPSSLFLHLLLNLTQPQPTTNSDSSLSSPELLPMPGYDIYYSIGSDMRGRAIVALNDIVLMNINKLPSGRAIAAECKGLYIVNIYAPSGTEKRTEREYFYNVDVPQLLQIRHGEIIIGSDFNCVLVPADTSGNFHTSRALTVMIRGFHLTDTWKKDPNRPAYTHYSNTVASRIYRTCVSRNIASRVTGIVFLPAAFTDHNAVVARLALGEMGARRRSPRWKLDPTMLRDHELLNQLRQQWSKCQTHKSWYPNVNIWWDLFVKPRLQRYLRTWSAEQRPDFKVMKEHLYTYIYDIQKHDTSTDKKHAALNRYRDKLVRHQARRA